MQIIMWVGGMPFNGETISSGQSLGGSESAGYYMAKELSKRGHTVTVFTSEPKGGTWDGVRYSFFGETTQQAPMGEIFHNVAQVPHDVMIIQRHPLAFLFNYNSKVNVWWLHDIGQKRNALNVASHLPFIDKTFTVSEWHKDQISGAYNINPEYITATRNGLYYPDYDAILGQNREREERSLIFASRPERGLEQLVKEGGIMEQLHDCKLYVCGYDNTVPQLRAYYEALWRRCDALPNVENLGAIGKMELAEKMAECMLYVYPTTFEDTSCMIAMEANAVGTPIVGFQTGALPETMRYGGASLLPLDGGKLDEKAFIKEVRRILKTSRWDMLHQKALGKRQEWSSVAYDWEAEFQGIMEEKSGTPERLHKHLEQMSDIKALDLSYCEMGMEVPERIRRLYSFVYDDNYAEHYKAYYQYEADRGVNYGAEDLTGNQRFEEVSQIIKDAKPETVLDYGCAHGHYAMNLLARHNFIDMIHGADLDASNIKKATAWAEQAGVADRTLFRECDYMGLVADRYDVIMLGEVLEHVADPAELVQHLLEYNTHEDTLFIITVPYGGWEALGYKEHPEWRAHIHHLERADLFEMFGQQKDYQLTGLPHGIQNMGHLLVTFKPSGAGVGSIDYNRKLKEQAPAETVSVCMIAKDEANNIGRAFESIKDIADEIIVGIDETTTDETEQVCRKYGAKVISIKSPLETGFDEARNATIEQAVMDWIIWLDADEAIENVQELRRYLRNNHYDGYAISQHHFTVQPAPMLLTTDLPTRIFRNNRGTHFIGHVHEHPRIDGKEGGGRVLLLPDISIMHVGYATEWKRRKRFERNFPLIQKDRQRHPERKLGKFLYLRDLLHYIRYTLEVNGNQLTPDLLNIAENIITMWRELLEMKETRLVLDSLAWYSDAVKIFNGGAGIDCAILVEGVPSNGVNPFLNRTYQKEVITGTFLDKNDIDKLQRHLLDVRIDPYLEKYF